MASELVVEIGSFSETNVIQKLEFSLAWLSTNIPNPPAKFPVKWEVINSLVNEFESIVSIKFRNEYDMQWFTESFQLR
jgi:hypothetical protein